MAALDTILDLSPLAYWPFDGDGVEEVAAVNATAESDGNFAASGGPRSGVGMLERVSGVGALATTATAIGASPTDFTLIFAGYSNAGITSAGSTEYSIYWDSSDYIDFSAIGLTRFLVNNSSVWWDETVPFPAVPAATWVVWAYRRSGSTWSIYRSDTDTFYSPSGGSTTTALDNKSWSFGGRTSVEVNPWNGDLAETAIFNTALSDTDIRAISDAILNGDPVPEFLIAPETDTALPLSVIRNASIDYADTSSGSIDTVRVLLAEIDYIDGSEGELPPPVTINFGRVAYTTVSDGSVTIPPIEGPFRVEMVGFDAAPIASIENATISNIVFALNGWETWSFSLPVSDPKAQHILSERFREAQIWKGDILLSWGPMTRPQVANGQVTVQGVGASWHLSRRHVGKANRDNLLLNPSFEQGLKSWNFLRTAYFLDYRRLDPNQVRIYGPGRDGNNALEINMDLRPYVPPPSSVGPGTIGTHTVVSGDTLWKIADTYYNSGTQWPTIYNANKTQIMNDAVAAGLWNPKDPGHWIFPGQMLTIPGLKVEEVPPEPLDDGTLWGDTFGYQEITVSGGDRGATITMAGWVKVPSQYLIGWGLGRGLLLERLATNYKTNNQWTQTGQPNTWGGRRAYYTDVIEHAFSRLSEGHPLNGWIRHEVSITVPAGKTEIVQARVCGVQGKTYWDKLTLTQDTAFEKHDTDQALIVKALVEHAQDPAFDKASINITTDTPKTGVKRDLVALHSEHANIWDLITEQTSFENGFDVGMRYTPTNRIVTTHYPFKGRTRSGLHLRLGRNIASYDWTFDGESAASSTIVLGSGSGSDREEAVTIIEDAFAGDIILETVTALGPEVPVDRLQEISDELAVVNKNPEILNIVTYPHDPTKKERRFIGYLEVGDLLPVTILDGPIYDESDQLTGFNFGVNDIYRVTQITMNPDDSLSLALNRRDFGNA